MIKRFRRLRTTSTIRSLVQETTLSKNDLIYPLFIVNGERIRKEVTSMPDVFQLSLDEAIHEMKECLTLGIKAFILFGIPSVKDSIGSDALCEHGIIARAIRELKNACPESYIITDLCFCEYTDHGHCGILDPHYHTVNNDATLEILAKQALIHAKAGVDMIAPSGMMDGTIQVLREALDNNGFENLPLMSYSTKFASSYYGPFRDAAESAPGMGDRKSYQMNPANRYEAIEESLEDERQGADILMVKPALAYLDIIRDIRNTTHLPLCVYNVSGEYSMLKLAGRSGIIDYNKVLMETMIAFKRAGANLIITYHAKEVCTLLDTHSF